MSVLESLSGNIADFLVSILSGISLFIDSIVYQLLGYAYNLFNVVASARVLSQDTLATLANRVYIIIGVIALFLVAYALLTAIIDPDKASKGDTSLGKIVPNIAIAIVAIALVPTVFSYAYRIQKIILCDNLIAKWILDTNPTSSDDAGAYLATTLFQSFYYPKTSGDDEKANNNSAGITSEEEYNTRLDNIVDSEGQSLSSAFELVRTGKQTLFDALGNFNKNIKNKEIGYFIIISTLAGGFCVYVLINYCFDAAKRAVKLAYLQLIAPLPILTIIIPGQKKIFQNWLKKTISCFTEIFVRIFVIVIVAFIAENLPNLVFNMSSMFNDGYGCVTEIGLVTALLVKALLILGLFAFAKEAPKLISDITGVDSKGFKLGIRDKLSEVGAFQAMAGLGGFVAATANGVVGAGRVLRDTHQALKNGSLKNAADTFKKGVGKGIAGIPRKYTSAYYSYRNAKNAKTMDEVGQAISKGTAQGMSAPGFWKSAIDNIKETANNIKNTIGADYEPYNSKLNLRKAATMDEIQNKIDEMKALADKMAAGKIKDLEQVYDASVKKAQSDFSNGTIDEKTLASRLKASREQFDVDKRKAEYEKLNSNSQEMIAKRRELAGLFASNPEIIKEAATIGGGHFDENGDSADLYGNYLNHRKEVIENIESGAIFRDLPLGQKSVVFELGNNLRSASSKIKTTAIEQENKQKDNK